MGSDSQKIESKWGKDEFLNETEDYIVNIYGDIGEKLKSYSGFDSMIRELLQNSDDSADEQIVDVDLFFNEDALVLKNNTVFTERDWEHIREISSGNKKNDPNRAGRFGIGFTSVFKICDRLNIHSKGISKNLDLGTIKWKTYKKPKYNENNVTEFEFFWRTESSSVYKQIGGDLVTPQKREEYINEVMRSIDTDLYFLRNIRKIRIYEKEKLRKNIEINRTFLNLGSVNLQKELKTIRINGNTSNVYLYHYKLKDQFSEEYNSGIARDCSISLSIALDCSNFKNGKIFCTLPTEIDTGSPINVNSDFQPDPNRKQIITKKDDGNGSYNFKIFSYLPDLIYSIIDDLKSTLTIEYFYTLLDSCCNNNRFDNSFHKFIDKLISSDRDVIFINNKWYPISNVKFSKSNEIIPFLERIGYPIISNEYSRYYSLFEKLGVKEFELEDLISLIKAKVPNKTLLEESIFESKDELISIFSYLKKLEQLDVNKVEENKEKIKQISIFLTNKSKLINISKGKIRRYPKELELVEEDFLFKQIDNDLFHTFKELLERLDIFTVVTPKDVIWVLSHDFKDQLFPLELKDSKPYLNTKEKFIVILHFLDPFLKILLQLKNNQQISKNLIDKFEINSLNEEFIRPQTNNYHRLSEFFLQEIKIKYLPLSLSKEGLLYPLENNKVFNLKSAIENEFASRYGLVSVDPDIASILGIYGNSFIKELDLNTIFFYVRKDCESGKKLEKTFLILLYRLMVDKKKQLIGNNELKLLIKNLPIFIDNKGNICSLGDEREKIFLQGSFNDYTGIARILNNEIIDSVEGFKKFILIEHFKIKTLDFRLFVENYFEEIFNESNVDTDKKLRLITDLSKSNLISEKSEKVIKILKDTKFIYCKDQKFHDPHESDIFYLATKEKENFASKNGLPIMSSDVKIIVNRLNLIKELGLDEILLYLENSFNKHVIFTDSDIVLLYTIILNDHKGLQSKKELNSRIRRLPLFKNTKGNICTLENNEKEMKLQGDYIDPIGIDEILSNDLIDKVSKFKEIVLKNDLGIKTLDFRLFVNEYFPKIFSDESIEKSKKVELLNELNKKFRNLENDQFINALKTIKLVYCQDGNFYCPNDENIYFKDKLIDEIFEDDYLFPNLEYFEDYRYMYEKLGIKSQPSPREIINYVKKKISSEKVDSNLINKMKNIFVYVNEHWESYGTKVEEFSELAEIKWLPATDDSKTLYIPSSLFIQSKGQNTRPYLMYLDNLRYLDIKDQSINKDLIDILGLKNIYRIPTSLIIDNIEQASKKCKPLVHYLEIYKEINRRIGNKSYNSWAQDISRLNDFPSIYINYKNKNELNESEFSFFEPGQTLQNNFTSLYGNEYIGYLTKKFVVECEKLLKYLDILEEPNSLTIKLIFESINNKYKEKDYVLSSEKDKSIVINCLKELNKNINNQSQRLDLIPELQKLRILYNDKNVLLKPDMAILEDNPNLADQFREKLGNYFVKYNTEYLNLIDRLKIKRLSKLVKKSKNPNPDVSLLKINEEYTNKVRWISKLLPRIKIENKLLEDEWKEIGSEIKVYQFDDLLVSKYIELNGQPYNSCACERNCYIEMDGNVFSEIYVKGSNEEILKSFAEELFEDIHPNINKNFKAVIYTLLTKVSLQDMDKYLTDLGYAQVEKPSSTLCTNPPDDDPQPEIDIIRVRPSDKPKDIQIGQPKKNQYIQIGIQPKTGSRTQPKESLDSLDVTRYRIKITEKIKNAPRKTSKPKPRTIRVSKVEIDPTTWLKEQYKDRDGLICQICKKVMPFKTRNGEYYFEAVESFDDLYFEMEEIYLALCPVCAAKYKEYVKPKNKNGGELERANMEKFKLDIMKSKFDNSDFYRIPIMLDKSETVSFTKKHIIAIKTILESTFRTLAEIGK